MSIAHDLAWCAGFFDGEGYVTIGRRKHKIKGKEYTGHYLRVGINHVAKEPLVEFQRILGGRLEYSENVAGNRKPRWRWIANTSRAKEILIMLMPYFKNKQKVAELGIEFQNTMNKCFKGFGNGVPPEMTVIRESLKNKLVELNAKD